MCFPNGNECDDIYWFHTNNNNMLERLWAWKRNHPLYRSIWKNCVYFKSNSHLILCDVFIYQSQLWRHKCLPLDNNETHNWFFEAFSSVFLKSIILHKSRIQTLIFHQWIKYMELETIFGNKRRRPWMIRSAVHLWLSQL